MKSTTVIIKSLGLIIVFGLISIIFLAVSFFNPWYNDEYAIRQEAEKYQGGYLSYYTQEMWDGTIQRVFYSDAPGPEKIKAIKGNIAEPFGQMVAIDFRQPRQEYGEGLLLEKNNVVFCGASGCKNITHMSLHQVNRQ